MPNVQDPLAAVFLHPVNALHRQYEALRAFFVEKRSGREVAARFGYTLGSFRLLCHEFRHDPKQAFFLPHRHAQPEASALSRTQAQVLELRKQNHSIYEIHRLLQESGVALSAPTIWKILHTHGFAKLPRRADEERLAGVKVEAARASDARRVHFAPRQFRTDFGGLFLFIPQLMALDFERVIAAVGLPGTEQIPAAHALRALLALKLFGRARHSHAMPNVFDEGLALFAGLEVIPKRTFLTQYSNRIDPRCYPRLMREWFDALERVQLVRGESFHLDFHTIPFHGEAALLEKHYVSKRSRRQKGVLAFLAQDAVQQMFCYARAGVRKAEHSDEVLRFVEFWQARTGGLPKELIFDSQLTTYANLSKLNAQGIHFITLRRRGKRLLERLHENPAAWRRIELPSLSRQFRTPQILDEPITLEDYAGPIRQIAIRGLGHEAPTLLLSNQLRRAAAGDLISVYAKRMLIENAIADGVEFFHLDALSSAVPLKTNCDLELTLMASSLYRLLGQRIGGEYATAKSAHLFRDFIEASARVTITPDAVEVAFSKRAHNPLLLGADFHKTNTAVPWWGNRKLKLAFGG